MSRVDFEAVNAHALAALRGLIQQWLPGGRFDGDEYVIGDLNGSKGRSTKFNVKTGKGGDFSSADGMAGDPIGIYALIFKMERIDAARELAKQFGLEGGAGTLTPTRPQHEVQQQADATEESDAQKLERVHELLAPCVSVRGTPAEVYLRSRHLRGAPAGTIKWWPEQDYIKDGKLRRKARPGYGALCCIARNAEGEPVALQMVSLTPAGVKEPGREVVKRSFGVIRGSCMLLPGRQPGTGPLLMTEGPEDGFTLWQATGMDVAVAFGIYALSRVPIADGRPVIFVRDNDPIGSDADKATARVTLRLLERGVNLLMTRPPDSVKDSNDLLRGFGPEAVVAMVNEAMPVRNTLNDAPPPEDIAPAPPPVDPDQGGVVHMPPPEFQECSEYPPTDTGNAQRVVKRWGSILMYSPGLGWHIFGRGVWDANMADMRVLKMAQVTAQDILQECSFLPPREAKERYKWANKSQMGGHIQYAIKLACPYVARNPLSLDADPHLFNCLNGVVDLRTGLLHPHSAGLLMTKQAPVEYQPDAKCPTWEKFLREIFLTSTDMPAHVQRAVGYSLTGEVSEQCMFIAHGYGSNGKSTFLETLQAILGPYWTKTQAETFAAQDRQNPGAPNPSVAALRGARFVTASETNEGLRLNEGLVKEVTGDAFITVRKLHQEPFTYRPSFKLWLGTNHKPEIIGTDHGIWRRLRLLPFDATFYDPVDADAPTHGPFKDKTLPAKLRAELPGILAWAVRGAMAWYKSGLDTPASVMAATIEYRNEMDTLGAFLGEATEVRLGATATSAGLYEAYRRWAHENGHRFQMTKNKFGRKLRERGHRVEKDHTGAMSVFDLVVKQGYGPKQSAIAPSDDNWHLQEPR